jgi:hypothetical protein
VPAAASRNHPFNEPTHGSQSAPYQPGQPRRTDPHAAAARRCLSAVALRRLEGVAESPEELVAARRGGHPAPPLRELLVLDIFTCRSNNSISLPYFLLAEVGGSPSLSLWLGRQFRNQPQISKLLQDQRRAGDLIKKHREFAHAVRRRG